MDLMVDGRFGHGRFGLGHFGIGCFSLGHFGQAFFPRVDVLGRFYYKKVFLLKPTQDCNAQVIDHKFLRCEIENLNFNRSKSRESSSFEIYSGLHCSGD